MTDEKYRPQNLHDALVRLMEECAEVIEACSKALRFGIHDVKPGGSEHNLEKIKREVGDIETAYVDMLKFYNADYQMSPKRRVCEHFYATTLPNCLFCGLIKETTNDAG